MKHSQKQISVLVGICVGCGKTQELSQYQIKEAQIDGCAMSPCCNMPLIIEKVQSKKDKP